MHRRYSPNFRQWTTLAVVALCFSSVATAEPLRVHGRVGAAAPATGPQSSEQSWGVLTEALLEWPMIPELGLGLGLGTVSLSDGTPPADDTLSDPTGASGVSGSDASRAFFVRWWKCALEAFIGTASRAGFARSLQIASLSRPI